MDSKALLSYAAVFLAGVFAGTLANGKRKSPKPVPDSGVEAEPAPASPVPEGPLKMVLVVRNDLGMKKGKIAAQCGHATLGAYQLSMEENPSFVAAWEERGQAKIVLRADTEDQMLEVAAACRAAGLSHYIVVDAGRTQIAPNSRTVLGIGPAPIGFIDAITGKGGSHPLKLVS